MVILQLLTAKPAIAQAHVVETAVPDGNLMDIVDQNAGNWPDVMNGPYVAADGYTYDRKAAQVWLEMNDTSPMTNLPLPSKILIPNYTLHSAIIEWKVTKEIATKSNE
ncbi:U-box domain-containing protein 52 [Morus notabilis]|uniref:RING-type E3 ubiquitin transferase n=1 Tax=Morus notabilis TaxID=981085 RepID=W9SQN8_9ROSA|nr:U-box domain-containing protein 52 [Morus notabilis]